MRAQAPHLSGRRRSVRSCRRSLRRDDAALYLVQLDRFEQCLEIALAEALIALALDDLEEDRADHILGEDLEQESLAGLRGAVDQDAALAHLLDRMAVAGHALVDHVVIGVRAVLEADAVAAAVVDGREDAVGGAGEMLDAFAL